MDAKQLAIIVEAVKAALVVDGVKGKEGSGGALVGSAGAVEAGVKRVEGGVLVDVGEPTVVVDGSACVAGGEDAAGSVSSGSWADEVSGEEALSRGELPEGGCAACTWGVGECTCIRVTPVGGKRSYAKVAEVAVPDAVVKDVRAANVGFFRQYVDVDGVHKLKRELETVARCKLPRDAKVELALVTYTPGTVPDAFVDGAKRIAGLALIGDAAMTLVLASVVYARGMTADSVQSARTRLLSNPKMQKVFSASKLAKYVVVPRGVTLADCKTGADSCEAMAGVLFNWAGVPAVRAYMAALGLLPGA